MKNTKVILLLLLIVVFGLLVRLIFFTQVQPSDDLEYYNFAHQINQDTFEHGVSFHSPRIGLTYSTALFYTLIGVNEVASNLLPLLTSILSIILVFYLGKIIFNETVGLIAAFLLSFFPLNVFYSTTLFPDLPSAFFIALSAFLFLKAEKHGRNLNYMLAGLSIGVAYLMKELSILILGFFVVYVFFKKNLKKEHFLILLGFFLIFGFELIYYTIKTSDPLFRYTIVSDQATNIMKTYYPNYFGINVLSRLFLHYPYLILTNPLTSLFYIFIIISSAYCILKKKKESYVLLMWIIPIALYVNFGSLSFSGYIPLPADVRYIEIITIPTILLLSYFLYQSRDLVNRLFMPATILFLFATSIYFIASNDQRTSLDNLYKASSYLKTSPEKIIYSDQRSTEVIRYLFNYEKNDMVITFNDYNGFEFKGERNNLIVLDNIHDVYVVVNWKMINGLLTNYKDMELPQEIINIPKNWVERFSYGEGKDRLIVYYVS